MIFFRVRFPATTAPLTRGNSTRNLLEGSPALEKTALFMHFSIFSTCLSKALVGFVMDGRQIARHGYPVRAGDAVGTLAVYEDGRYS